MPYQTFAAMPEHSHLWIYQSPRALNNNEIEWLMAENKQFINQWTSHQHTLTASAIFLQQHFLILAVDEQSAGASGCAVDKSVAFVQRMGQQLQVDFFDRWQFAFLDKDKLQVVDKEQFAQLYQQGKINKETKVFNNLITKKAELATHWQVPLAQSWHTRFV